MKIKVHSSEMNRMMKIISQCIDPRFTNLSNIEITYDNNLLTIHGTNGTFHATLSTPILGGDGESFQVDGTMFSKVCSISNGEVEISTDEKTCTIKGAGRTRLPIMHTNIPAQTPVKGSSVIVDAEEFTGCFNGVSYAISADQSRIQLTGVLAYASESTMRMVALDGFQLSIEDIGYDGEDMKIIIPGTFMKLIVQGSDSGEQIKLTTNGTQLEASTDSMKLTCGLLTGEFPNYSRILPSEFSTECLVKVEELKNALKCGSIISSKQNLVKLEIESDHIKVMSNSEEADYDADVPCDTHGNTLKIAFNQKYLMNSISAINAEEAVLKFNTSVAPCVMQGKDDDGIRLLLPVRVMG